MSENKVFRFLLPVLVLAVAAGAVFVLQENKPEVVEEEVEFPPLVVTTAQVKRDQIRWKSLFQGEVRAQTNIELVSQVTGKVIEVSDQFIEGGQFEIGETLLKIDSADYQVALESAEAAVAEAQVALDIELATADIREREWAALKGKKLSEAKPLQLNRPQVLRAKARLEAAQAQLAAAQLDLDRTQISAPFAGRVLNKSAGLGQFVARGSGVGRVFASDVVEIRIPMTDTQLAELELYMGYSGSPDSSPNVRVFVGFGSHQHQWNGYLRTIDASIDTDTRLVYGTVAVEKPYQLNTDHQIPLAPGLFVDVEIDSAREIVGLRVPRDALRNDNRVYLVEDGELHIRDVSVLLTSENQVVLDAGISAEDQVVISPVPGAYSGMAVEIKGEEVVAESEVEDTQS